MAIILLVTAAASKIGVIGVCTHTGWCWLAEYLDGKWGDIWQHSNQHGETHSMFQIHHTHTYI